MKTLITLIALLVFVPSIASAHAIPTAYIPDSSAIIATSPDSVTITFSERIDIGASSIRVTGPHGTLVSQGKPVAAASDPRTISVPVTSAEEGAYLVSWAVVSSDDGHFTKGTYAFAVGSGIDVPLLTASSEVVKIATAPEAIAMTVELFGHGLLWAVLVLFVVGVRPLLLRGTYAGDERTIRRGYAIFLLTGVALALFGGAFQIYTKSLDLASLDGAPFLDALVAYVQTAAGFSTGVRMVMAALIGVVFVMGRKAISASKRITFYEYLMFALLCVFAFFRAKISHATANPFFPELSIAVNFIHLIEKDIWAGILTILGGAAMFPKLREFLHALIEKAFTILSLNLALVAVTATYIVWLHLKSFSNLFTTEWGTNFLVLFAVALGLVVARVYHVLTRRYVPATFARFLPATLAVECALGILLIYASSVVIITSPPLAAAHTRTFSASDQGIELRLEAHPFEDGMALLSVQGNDAMPAVEARQENGAAFDIALMGRFASGYAFPASLLAGTEPYELDIIVPNADGYDAHTQFSVRSTDLIPAKGEGNRAFDMFTFSMIGIACVVLIFALGMYRLTRANVYMSSSTSRFPASIAVPVVVLIVLSVGAIGMRTLAASPLVNLFKALCESDGNMWHSMLPSKAGIPTSAIPREGCMWGMGDQMYMFADAREYASYRKLPPANVTLATAPSALLPNVPTTLTFTLTNADGTPATLFYDMEKLIHVVIVSEDQNVFAHIHADDDVPLSEEAIKTSTFSVSYTFPKVGRYLVSADYAHGLTLETKQFIVDVGMSGTRPVATYDSPGMFGGYQVSLRYDLARAGEVVTLRYHISKEGVPVTTLVPYLAAAMHVSAVKNDLASFIHTHGEIHPPGVPYPPIVVKDGRIVHSMASMITPPAFGPDIEAHLIFPEPGLYTIWGEFSDGDAVIPTAFTVRVD